MWLHPGDESDTKIERELRVFSFKRGLCWGEKSEKVEMVEGYLRGTDQGALALGSYSRKTQVIVLIITK